MRAVQMLLVIFVAALIFYSGKTEETENQKSFLSAKFYFQKNRYLIKFFPKTPLGERKAFFYKAGIKPIEFDVFGYDIGEVNGAKKIQAPFILNYEIENPKKVAILKGGCQVRSSERLKNLKNKNKLITQWYEDILGVRKAHKFLADKKVKLQPEGVVVIDDGPILTHTDIGPALKKNKDGRAIIWARWKNRNKRNDHGTSVACLSAGYHDGKGIEGVAGPSAYILPIILDFGNETFYFSSDIARGLKYYAQLEKKGDITFHTVNMSLGNFYESAIIKTAIESLSDKLFVVAGSNEYGRNIDTHPVYPASWGLPNILAVAATDKDDAMAKLSNIGPIKMEIAAPGANVISCVGGNKYLSQNGTSLSAPLVAGAAALLHAMAPKLTVAETKDYLFRGADRLPVLEGKINGARRLNVLKTVILMWNSRRSEIQINNLP